MDGRDHSRTPRGMREDPLPEELQRLIEDRERARQAKDFALADQLRERLAAAGIILHDKTGLWKTEDGRQGRIPRFSEIMGASGASGMEGWLSPGAGQEASADMGGGAPAPSEEAVQIRHLVSQREAARAAKDFTESDRLRDELKAMGVELFDKEKMWRTQTGLAGIIIGYRGDQVSDVEITTLVQEREKARHDNDYTKADMIRNELKEAGVEILDKQKQWRTSDGRSGPVPSWDEVLGKTPAHAQMFAQTPVAMHYAVAPGMDIKSQLVNAAVQASMNPAIAQRALLMLQQLIASAPAAYVPQAAPPLPPPSAAPRKSQATRTAAAPTPSSSPELTQAFTFVAQCRQSGFGVNDLDIVWLVQTRERLRQNKDFAGADKLREEMKTLGIELQEREKRWQTTDGRSGTIPSWSEIV
eukprot:TRINITY_DN19640_c0_g1_i1.p1 TRINITY_DN19640_c0_g1~~TRINITY_DN19640_c0_g1_i1.p1  ORF type:complete len:415 (+),score=101.12 TRINITY_DN19640_c0_g1_i1:185-1429(+)